MPKDPLAYKFTGKLKPDGLADEFLMGVPSRDIKRSEFDGMSDADKAALHSSPIHRAYGHADEEAEKAAERVQEAEERHPAAPAPAAAPAPPPAPVRDADAGKAAKK